MQAIYIIPVQNHQLKYAPLTLESIAKCHRKAGLQYPKITCILSHDTALKTRVQYDTMNYTQSPLEALTALTLSRETHIIFLSPDTILTNPPLWVLSGFDFCAFHNGGNLAPNNKAFSMSDELLQSVQNYVTNQPLDDLRDTLQFLPTVCTIASLLSTRPKVFPPIAKDRMFIGAFCHSSYASDSAPLYIMDCAGGFVNDFAVAGLSVEQCIFNSMRSILRRV